MAVATRRSHSSWIGVGAAFVAYYLVSSFVGISFVSSPALRSQSLENVESREGIGQRARISHLADPYASSNAGNSVAVPFFAFAVAIGLLLAGPVKANAEVQPSLSAALKSGRPIVVEFSMPSS